MLKQSILLVDGYSLLFRGFHALPLLTHGGEYTNAVHGFFSMLNKTLAQYNPTYLCVMLDAHAPTFRHTLYSDYKGTRKPAPEELKPQFTLLRELLDSLHIHRIEMEGYEADDLLGSAAKIANDMGIHAYILTGDRDSFQLINASTSVIFTKSGITENIELTPENIVTEYGYTPEMVIDLKGLMGDSSDNIPGIAGIGPKTALKLLSQYNTLEKVLADSENIKGKMGEKIRASKEDALLSKTLATIETNAPIPMDISNCTWNEMSFGIDALKKYGLNRIAQSIKNLKAPTFNKDTSQNTNKTTKKVPTPTSNKVSAPIDPKAIYITELTQFQELFSNNKTTDAPLSFYQDSFSISLYISESNSLIIFPIRQNLIQDGFFEDEIWKTISFVLSSYSLICHDAKKLYHELDGLKITLPNIFFDTLLSSYLLFSGQKSYTFSDCYALNFTSELSENPNAYNVYTLYNTQQTQLQTENLSLLYNDIEFPLFEVLYSMEKTGFSLDKQVLKTLSKQFSARIENCKNEVFKLLNVPPFNLNSPKQLGEVLFDTLKLPSPKKTKTGNYSTSAEVLENLIPLSPAIIPLLDYRKISKLQSTYVEGLQKLIGTDGRVHTTFDQTTVITGRISSYEPNLQNIPIRSNEGREIRSAFVAKEGYVLIDADYSQIELRILAHMSEDPALQDAFIHGQDIHTRTASEVYNVPMNEVTADMRRQAKAINFGIIYGISAFGLSKNANISRKEAEMFIATYFERYPKVKEFIDNCVATGYKTGQIDTLLGRKRILNELQSSNHNTRNFGERAAMNTPVQGTAADIIKMAMVSIYQKLKNSSFDAKLILQVHDELIIECKEEQADEVSKLLVNTMQQAVALSVPLVADVNIGKTWEQAH